MSKGDVRGKKQAYFVKLEQLLQEYKSIFIVNVDNVGSNQMHQIRHSLRNEAVVLMGKNTMVRRALRNLIPDNVEYEKLLALIRGNIGFVFTNGDLKTVRDKLSSNRVVAPARAGAVAPLDVVVPAGNTGMEPGKTSFFQALGIPTKIARGTVEITSDVTVITAGNKVGPSEATLLNMLNISPFTYGMTVETVYDDGAVFEPSILDITDEHIIKTFTSGLTNIATISLAISYPTIAAVPHVLINGYKNVAAISLATDYTIESVKELKEILADPTKLAALSAAAASSAPAAAGDAPAAAAAEEEKEESDDDMGFGLFD